MLKGRSRFYGDKIEERRLNDCVTSLRHHNDVRSLTTNSIIDRHYFSSVSFRILVLEQQWSNACNILPSFVPKALWWWYWHSFSNLYKFLNFINSKADKTRYTEPSFRIWSKNFEDRPFVLVCSLENQPKIDFHQFWS